jgi:hypothetical protein
MQKTILQFDYSGKTVVFDFFKSLYSLNWKDIENNWYIDDDGKRSEIIPTCEEYNEGLEAHICKTVALYCTKKPCWSYEGEQALFSTMHWNNTIRKKIVT